MRRSGHADLCRSGCCARASWLLVCGRSLPANESGGLLVTTHCSLAPTSSSTEMVGSRTYTSPLTRPTVLGRRILSPSFEGSTTRKTLSPANPGPRATGGTMNASTKSRSLCGARILVVAASWHRPIPRRRSRRAHPVSCPRRFDGLNKLFVAGAEFAVERSVLRARLAPARNSVRGSVRIPAGLFVASPREGVHLSSSCVRTEGAQEIAICRYFVLRRWGHVWAYGTACRAYKDNINTIFAGILEGGSDGTRTRDLRRDRPSRARRRPPTNHSERLICRALSRRGRLRPAWLS